MDGPKKPTLLFPLPGKTQKGSLDEWWGLVQKTFWVYFALPSSSVFNVLPIDVQKIITRFLFMINNPSSFSTAEDQFFRKLFGCCITLSCKEKKWMFPRNTQITYDHRYYVYRERAWLIIYDKKEKRCIKKFQIDPNKYFGLLRSRNIVLFFSGNGCCVYHIETQILQVLGQMRISAISDNYIVGFDQENIYVWNIAQFEHIICYSYKFNGLLLKFVTLGCDGEYFVYTSADQKIVLLKIKDGFLQKVAESNLEMSDGDHCVKFVQNNKYLVVYNSIDKILFKEGFKLKKNSEGLISLKKIFNEKENHLWHASPENVFLVDFQGGMVLKDYRERDLAQWNYCVGDPFNHSSNGKHIFFRSLVDGQKKDIIKHALFNQKKECVGFAQDLVDGMYDKVTFNKSATALLGKKKGGKELCLHLLDGTKLLSLNIGSSYNIMHSNQRFIFFKDIKGLGKKYVLYPCKADKYLKSLAHRQLSFAQIAGLELLCGHVAELRKNIFNT